MAAPCKAKSNRNACLEDILLCDWLAVASYITPLGGKWSKKIESKIIIGKKPNKNKQEEFLKKKLLQNTRGKNEFDFVLYNRKQKYNYKLRILVYRESNNIK